MSDEYKTVQDISHGLYKEKGSRFIAVAMPVNSTEQVKLSLEQLRKEYHDARHHCYAYRLGEFPYESRFNDDGEPSGTAGKPIFGQIQSFDLTNILVVVIRYFGGVKLGTGGLIQAYRSAAKNALENSTIHVKTWKLTLEVRFDYDRMNDVMRMIKEDGLHVLKIDTGEKYAILLEINKSSFETCKKKMMTLKSLEMTVI
jgi:uncharacterized YigZ family protein